MSYQLQEGTMYSKRRHWSCERNWAISNQDIQIHWSLWCALSRNMWHWQMTLRWNIWKMNAGPFLGHLSWNYFFCGEVCNWGYHLHCWNLQWCLWWKSFSWRFFSMTYQFPWELWLIPLGILEWWSNCEDSKSWFQTRIDERDSDTKICILWWAFSLDLCEKTCPLPKNRHFAPNFLFCILKLLLDVASTCIFPHIPPWHGSNSFSSMN